MTDKEKSPNDKQVLLVLKKMKMYQERPLVMLLEAAEKLKWTVAVPQSGSLDQVDGLVIGTEEFINRELIEPETYDIFEKSQVN